jgi:hypothetical protein
MAVLFLDPLALTLVLGVLVHVWLVWRGTVGWWFGRTARWTVLVWPLPLLLLAVPVLAGSTFALLGRVGVEVGAGGLANAALYTALYGAPAVGFLLWPPRWLLPRWARTRLTALPADPAPSRPDAVPACHGRAGHGSRARWVWRVDAVPGWVWTEGASLCFRAVEDQDAAAASVPAVDAEALPELRWSGDDVWVEAPRGGWWSDRQLDVDLAAIDRWHVSATRPWRRDGLLTLEVEGRRPLHLWVADHRQVVGALPDV